MGLVVLGIGNILLSDEGIGCHIAHALEGISLPDVKVMDGGTSPDVLQLLEDVDKLIIVDAVRGGGMPGAIYRFHLDDIALEQKPFLSVHEVGLVENLSLMRLWHSIGEIIIIGVEPKEIGWGLELSPELQQRLPQIAEAVLAELNNGHKS
jgi:hydrogenase maturation protease